jgi:hypothetical protein
MRINTVVSAQIGRSALYLTELKPAVRKQMLHILRLYAASVMPVMTCMMMNGMRATAHFRSFTYFFVS